MNKRPTEEELIRKNARTGLVIFAVVIAMVALAFASVPLYDLFCRVTGFGGTTQTAISLPDHVLDRTITVKFNADTNHNLPWIFKPEMREISVKLGQRGVTTFYAKNRSDKPTAGTALYNVTPAKAGQYFHKIQCFCFDEQLLKPSEAMDMPVLFFIDPALNDDPNMQDVTHITLSYSFFPTNSNALEQALEAFYNSENE